MMARQIPAASLVGTYVGEHSMRVQWAGRRRLSARDEDVVRGTAAEQIAPAAPSASLRGG
jgi:hypothetical protein